MLQLFPSALVRNIPFRNGTYFPLAWNFAFNFASLFLRYPQRSRRFIFFSLSLRNYSPPVLFSSIVSWTGWSSLKGQRDFQKLLERVQTGERRKKFGSCWGNWILALDTVQGDAADPPTFVSDLYRRDGSRCFVSTRSRCRWSRWAPPRSPRFPLPPWFPAEDAPRYLISTDILSLERSIFHSPSRVGIEGFYVSDIFRERKGIKSL